MKPHLSLLQSNPRRESARTATVILTVIAFVSVLVAAMWYSKIARDRAGTPEVSGTNTTAVVLSESTQTVLNNLKSPVTIRFYAVLDPASTSESLRAFAARTDRLLSEYERAANDNLKVSRL